MYVLISAALTTVDILLCCCNAITADCAIFLAQKPLMKHSETEAEEVQVIFIMCCTIHQWINNPCHGVAWPIHIAEGLHSSLEPETNDTVVKPPSLDPCVWYLIDPCSFLDYHCPPYPVSLPLRTVFSARHTNNMGYNPSHIGWEGSGPRRLVTGSRSQKGSGCQLACWQVASQDSCCGALHSCDMCNSLPCVWRRPESFTRWWVTKR